MRLIPRALLTQADRVNAALRPLGHEYSPDFPLGHDIRIIRQPCVFRRVLGNVDHRGVQSKRLVNDGERS